MLKIITPFRIHKETNTPNVIERRTVRMYRQDLHIMRSSVTHISNASRNSLLGFTPIITVIVRKFSILGCRKNTTFWKSLKFISVFQREPFTFSQVCNFFAIIIKNVVRTSQDSRARRKQRNPPDLGPVKITVSS